jgi:hypothetical protein
MWIVEIEIEGRSFRQTFNTEAEARDFYKFMRVSVWSPMWLKLIDASPYCQETEVVQGLAGLNLD